MLDSGANIMCTNEQTAIALNRQIKYYQNSIKINFGGLHKVECTTYANFGKILGNVAIIQQLPTTLVPTIPFLDKGFVIIYMKGRSFILSKNGHIITTATQNKDGLFYFDLEPIVNFENLEEGGEIKTVNDLIEGLKLISSEANGCEILESKVHASRRDKRIPKESVLQVLWLHRCMNHPSAQTMANAIRNGSWIGIPDNITPALVETIFDKLDCPACEMGKRHKAPIPLGSGIKSIIPGQSLSVDYKGPINPSAYGGFKGFFIFVCDATSMIKIYLVKLKSEFPSIIRKIHAFYKRYGHQVKHLRFDAGTVENSKEATEVMDELNILPNGILKESQYQNAVEKHIQTLIDKVGASMCDQSTLGPAC